MSQSEDTLASWNEQRRLEFEAAVTDTATL